MNLHLIERRSTEPDPFTLVLLHGLGSNEQDLMGFAPQIPSRFNVVSVRAPFEYGAGGYAWFHIDFSDEGGPASLRVSPAQVLESVENLESFLTSFVGARSIPRERLVLGGFSQGAMMSAVVSLRQPQLLSAALLMSGLLLPLVSEVTGSEKRLPQYLVTHGTYDPIVPVAAGRQMASALRGYGASVQLQEYAMAHEVNYQCLADIVRWLNTLTQAPSQPVI